MGDFERDMLNGQSGSIYNDVSLMAATQAEARRALEEEFNRSTRRHTPKRVKHERVKLPRSRPTSRGSRLVWTALGLGWLLIGFVVFKTLTWFGVSHEQAMDLAVKSVPALIGIILIIGIVIALWRAGKATWRACLTGARWCHRQWRASIRHYSVLANNFARLRRSRHEDVRTHRIEPACGDVEERTSNRASTGNGLTYQPQRQRSKRRYGL